MNDFVSGFWDVYITLVTLASILACAIFLKSQSVRKAGAAESSSESATTGHTWDEDLAEYNNPLPRWWSWLFYITIVFSLGYLVLYPGLGSWPGTLGWSQVGQLKDEQSRAEKEYGPLYTKFAATDIEALTKNLEARAIGQKLFLNNCAQCHASDGGGSRGFPNLTAGAWQWGGDVKTIKTTIAEGRTGVMPAFGAALGEQGVKNVAQYVRSLSGLTADSIRVALGRDVYLQTCVACHGADGKGNPALGAPNLTDKNWLHGSAEETVIETIAKGRQSQMPAHKTLLDEARIHLLTAYVLSLSR